MSTKMKVVRKLKPPPMVMQAAGIGAWEYDLHDKTVSWCSTAHSLLGLGDGARPSIESALSTLHPDDRELTLATISQSKEAGRLAFECRVCWPDGSIHWLLAQGQVVRDGRGQPVRAAGILMDVTERRRLEEGRELVRHEADRSRELMRLFQNAPIGLAVIDARTGCYLLTNSTYESSPGPVRPGGCFIGHRVGEFAAPELAKFMNRVLQHVVETRQGFSVRGYEANFGPDRERSWWDNDVVPLLDEQGKVESVLAITKDVTQEVLARMRIEELAAQMEAGRDKLEAIINTMSEGLVVIEPSGKIASANPAALRLHGASNLSEVPENVWDYGSFFDLRYLDGRRFLQDESPLTEAMHGKAGASAELQGRRLDTGKTWIASYTSMPVRDQDGGLRLVIMAIHDLTPMKQAEQQLRKVMAELKRSNRDLEQFAYIASHDLQEPLRMVTSFLNLLEKRAGTALDSASREFVRFAVEGATRMSHLLQGLLLYSRVGTQGRQLEATQAREAVDEAVANLSMAESEASAKIIVGDLPTVTADRTQLIQLFQNLIGNALKFRRSGIAPCIEVGARKQDSAWLFWVRDNGIGIPRDETDRIFRVFQRLHSAADYPGAGVGLAVCRKIVERHGGEICVDSVEGEGSTFFFTLPLSG